MMIKKYTKLSIFIYVLTLVFVWQFGVSSQIAYAAIEYVGGVTASGRTSTYDVSLTSLTGGLASSPSEGDVVLILTGYGTDETDVDLSVSGFTELADLYAANPTTVNDSNMYAGYKIMGASPDTSVTVAGSGTDAYGGTAIIQVWRNVDVSNPIDAVTTTAISTTTMFIDPPANTPVSGGARIVALYYGTAANCGERTAGSNMTDYNMSVKGAPNPVGNGSSFSVVGSVFRHDLESFNPTPSTNAQCTGSNYSYAAATVILRPAIPPPAYVTRTSPVNTTTISRTYAWPTHETGDIGLLLIESQANEISLSTPAGFERIGTTQSATGTRLDAFWARATSAAMTSPVAAANSDHQIGSIHTFRGVVGTGNPFTVVAGDVKDAASTTSTAPAVTTTEDEQLIIVVVTSDLDSASVFASAAVNTNLTGITERTDSGTVSGNGGGLAVYTSLKLLEGDTGTTAVTVTSSASAMMTLALRGVGNPPTVALNSPADGAAAQSSTPTFNFTATDIEADTVEYQIQIDNNNDFSSPALDKVSETDSGFTAGHPFASGVAKDFTVQAGDALSSGTYYWRVRALDTTGSNGYGDWSETKSFTVGAVNEGTASETRSFLKFIGSGFKVDGGRILFQ